MRISSTLSLGFKIIVDEPIDDSKVNDVDVWLDVGMSQRNACDFNTLHC